MGAPTRIQEAHRAAVCATTKPTEMEAPQHRGEAEGGATPSSILDWKTEWRCSARRRRRRRMRCRPFATGRWAVADADTCCWWRRSRMVLQLPGLQCSGHWVLLTWAPTRTTTTVPKGSSSSLALLRSWPIRFGRLAHQLTLRWDMNGECDTCMVRRRRKDTSKIRKSSTLTRLQFRSVYHLECSAHDRIEAAVKTPVVVKRGGPLLDGKLPYDSLLFFVFGCLPEAIELFSCCC
jgi:hypothetical protein